MVAEPRRLARGRTAAPTFHQQAGHLQRRELLDKELVGTAEVFKVALFFRRVQATHPTHIPTDSMFALNLPRNW